MAERSPPPPFPTPALPVMTFGPAPAGPLDVGDGVDVWAVALDAAADVVEAGRALLDDGERARAARFHDPRHGARFVVRRAALRTVLARYVGAAPTALRFRRVGEARPRLVEPAADLVWSAADADDLALFALARRDPLGIDVERLREVPEHAEIAARYLAADDAAAVAAATDELARRLAFFRGWTRLEALSKALDGGVYRHVERRTAAGPRVAEGGIEPLVFTPRPPFVRAGETSPPADFVAALATDARGPRRAFAFPDGRRTFDLPEVRR
ncbi:MAG: 4'-phosphopantetheinyl transferase superfamily protein [Planctomycetota bacterium]